MKRAPHYSLGFMSFPSSSSAPHPAAAAAAAAAVKAAAAKKTRNRAICIGLIAFAGLGFVFPFYYMNKHNKQLGNQSIAHSHLN